MKTTTLRDTLAALIQDEEVAHVIDTIAALCQEQAEAACEANLDPESIASWVRASRTLAKAATQIEV